MSNVRLNFEYEFERRRYGTGASLRFYTWVNYRLIGSDEWHAYGDPWPKARLNKLELIEVENEITLRLLKPGTRVQTHNGPATIEDRQGDNFRAIMALFANRTFHLAPGNITEVLS
jgi:hypothetical protein